MSAFNPSHETINQYQNHVKIPVRNHLKILRSQQKAMTDVDNDDEIAAAAAVAAAAATQFLALCSATNKAVPCVVTYDNKISSKKQPKKRVLCLI